LRNPPCNTLFPYTTLFRSYDLTKAKFNKQVRVAGRELNEFRDGLDLDNIELPVNIQEEKKQELTQEQIEENAKLIREELNSLKRSEEHTSELQSRENLVCR